MIICFENVIQRFVFLGGGGFEFTVNMSRSLGGKHCHINLLGFIRKKYEMYFVDFSIFSSEPTQMANKTTNRCQQFKVTRNLKMGATIALNQRLLSTSARRSFVSVERSLVSERQREDGDCFLQLEMCLRI